VFFVLKVVQFESGNWWNHWVTQFSKASSSLESWMKSMVIPCHPPRVVLPVPESPGKLSWRHWSTNSSKPNISTSTAHMNTWHADLA
jgi:hypothetical protein